MGMSIIGLILYTLLPFGQLWTRVFDYNGSVDMWWFFLPFFMIFPLQFIPVLMLYLGYIKPGKGPVFDYYVWIPIIVKSCVVICGLFVPEEYTTYYFWIAQVIVLISIIITKYLHTYKICKDMKTLNATQFGNIVMNAIFENGVASIFFIVLKFIPVVGWIISFILDSFDSVRNIVQGLFWIFSYIFIYVIQNMFEQIDINNFCNPTSISPWNIAKCIIGMILFGVSIFVDTLSSFNPKKLLKPKNFKRFLKSKKFKKLLKYKHHNNSNNDINNDSNNDSYNDPNNDPNNDSTTNLN